MEFIKTILDFLFFKEFVILNNLSDLLVELVLGLYCFRIIILNLGSLV